MTYGNKEEKERNNIADNILSKTSIIVKNKEARTL